MPKWTETAKYKALEKRWYKKLKQSGFEDAEQDPTYLKQYSGKVIGRQKGEVSDEEKKAGGYVDWEKVLNNDTRTSAKAEYYRWCRHMLNDWEFDTKTDRRIFELHTEGLGVRVIVTILKRGWYRRKVQERLNGIIKKMRGK